MDAQGSQSEPLHQHPRPSGSSALRCFAPARSIPAFVAPLIWRLRSLEMRHDSVKSDKKADGGKDDRCEPPRLIPSGLFDGGLEFCVAGLESSVAALEFGVAALDDGGKVFVHSGLHEFGLGDGGGLNGTKWLRQPIFSS